MFIKSKGKDRYEIVKIFRHSKKRVVLARGVTRLQAARMVQSYPDNDKFMVVFYQME